MSFVFTFIDLKSLNTSRFNAEKTEIKEVQLTNVFIVLKRSKVQSSRAFISTSDTTTNICVCFCSFRIELKKPYIDCLKSGYLIHE